MNGGLGSWAAGKGAVGKVQRRSPGRELMSVPGSLLGTLGIIVKHLTLLGWSQRPCCAAAVRVTALPRSDMLPALEQDCSFPLPGGAFACHWPQGLVPAHPDGWPTVVQAGAPAALQAHSASLLPPASHQRWFACASFLRAAFSKRFSCRASALIQPDAGRVTEPGLRTQDTHLLGLLGTGR